MIAAYCTQPLLVLYSFESLSISASLHLLLCHRARPPAALSLIPDNTPITRQVPILLRYRNVSYSLVARLQFAHFAGMHIDRARAQATAEEQRAPDELQLQQLTRQPPVFTRRLEPLRARLDESVLLAVGKSFVFLGLDTNL